MPPKRGRKKTKGGYLLLMRLTLFKRKKDNQSLFLNFSKKVVKVIYINANNFLKGHRHDWGQCLFTKII